MRPFDRLRELNTPLTPNSSLSSRNQIMEVFNVSADTNGVLTKQVLNFVIAERTFVDDRVDADVVKSLAERIDCFKV